MRNNRNAGLSRWVAIVILGCSLLIGLATCESLKNSLLRSQLTRVPAELEEVVHGARDEKSARVAAIQMMRFLHSDFIRLALGRDQHWSSQTQITSIQRIAPGRFRVDYRVIVHTTREKGFVQRLKDEFEVGQASSAGVGGAWAWRFPADLRHLPNDRGDALLAFIANRQNPTVEAVLRLSERTDDDNWSALRGRLLEYGRRSGFKEEDLILVWVDVDGETSDREGWLLGWDASRGTWVRVSVPDFHER